MRPTLFLLALVASPGLLFPQAADVAPVNQRCANGYPNEPIATPFLLPSGIPCLASPQPPGLPWSGYARDPQHTATSAIAAQPMNRIHWQTAVDLNPPGGGVGDLLVHYGSPVITAANTVIVPVSTRSGGFQLNALSGATGSLLYTLPSDYILPAHDWVPPYGPALSPGTRLYYPGAGGTLYYRDLPNSAIGPNGQQGATGQVAFYGMTGASGYSANKAAFNATVQISTPLTTDRGGNVFFGFVVTGSNPKALVSGIARISAAGVGSWVSAVALTGDGSANQIALNCAPALSNDQRAVYVATADGYEFGAGYLTSLDATSLTPIAHVRLLDPRGGVATVSTDSSASPTVGPDGDVYFGVLENPCCNSHNDRGWLLHFDSSLARTKIPGSFGWDDTASVVPATAVPSYRGASSYLLLTKYNNYADGGGDGVNKVAILDPSAPMQDEYPSSPVTVMREVIAIVGATPDPDNGGFPAVKEWCINTAAIDPFSKVAIVNSEDGTVYRWDFATNTYSQRVFLTSGRAEAYTPTVIGPDGTVYAVNDAILFAVGK